MSIHRADKKAQNPRLQCMVCGKWKRLFTSKPQPPYGLSQTFFGGCSHNDGNDHLAGKVCKDGCNDVCATCCEIECKRLRQLRK